MMTDLWGEQEPARRALYWAMGFPLNGCLAHAKFGRVLSMERDGWVGRVMAWGFLSRCRLAEVMRYVLFSAFLWLSLSVMEDPAAVWP